MRASCLQENLSRGLSVVGRAVASRPTLPVLSHILLSTDQSQLKLAATDLELFIVCWLGARVEEEGAITIPARLFVDLINSLPPERVDLKLRDQMLHLSCARNEADINGIDADEFPLLPERLDDDPVIGVDLTGLALFGYENVSAGRGAVELLGAGASLARRDAGFRLDLIRASEGIEPFPELPTPAEADSLWRDLEAALTRPDCLVKRVSSLSALGLWKDGPV